MKVVFFQRRRAPEAFSIEGYFALVRSRLAGVEIAVSVAKHYSTSVRGFVSNLIDAIRAQGDVNHITGDIHYISYVLPRRRTVLTIHDCGFENNPSAWRRLLLKWIWFTIPVRRVAIVTTNSAFTRAKVLEHTGCRPDKVRVVPVCVATGFRPTPKPFNAERPTILLVGTRANKNVERVFAALNGIPCRVVVIGKMSEHQRMLAAELDYRNLSNLNEEDLVHAYVGADMVVFASTYEGFGMPIVEANAVGRPVVAGNAAAIPEVAADAACLVDPYSVEDIRGGILRVIEDEPYRNALVENGWTNWRRFVPERIAAEYLDIYRGLVVGGGVTGRRE